MKLFAVCLCLVLCAGLSNAELVAHWSMDQDSGSAVYDSQNGHHGVSSGTTLTSGKFSDARYFDGHDRINITESAELEQFSQLTLATWVYWTGYPKPGANYDFLAGVEAIYKIDISGSQIRFLTGNAWEDGILISNTSLTRNSWYHIAAVYDGTEKSIYINGVKDLNTVACTGTLGADQRYSFTMGAQPNIYGYEDYFTGKLDDVRVYNHALSVQEIQALLIPEPASIFLMGFAALAYLRRKHKS